MENTKYKNQEEKKINDEVSKRPSKEVDDQNKSLIKNFKILKKKKNKSYSKKTNEFDSIKKVSQLAKDSLNKEVDEKDSIIEIINEKYDDLHSKYKEHFEEYTKTLDELKELKSRENILQQNKRLKFGK